MCDLDGRKTIFSCRENWNKLRQWWPGRNHKNQFILERSWQIQNLQPKQRKKTCKYCHSSQWNYQKKLKILKFFRNFKDGWRRRKIFKCKLPEVHFTMRTTVPYNKQLTVLRNVSRYSPCAWLVSGYYKFKWSIHLITLHAMLFCLIEFTQDHRSQFQLRIPIFSYKVLSNTPFLTGQANFCVTHCQKKLLFCHDITLERKTCINIT